MKKGTVGKIALSIISLAAVLFCSFFIKFFSLLLGSPAVYFLVPIYIFAIAGFCALNSIWKFFDDKKQSKILLWSSVAAIASLGAIEAARYYNNSHEAAYEIDPFRMPLVALNEPSELAIANDLPRIDGATALYPLYASFALNTYPKDIDATSKYHQIPNIECSTTTGAYERLISGKADIIFVAGPSESQLQAARQAGVELKLTPIGYEAFVFFVHKANSVDGLDIESIQRIYSGKATSWKEFGGSGKIRAYQRNEGSGSQTALESIMAGTPLMQAPNEIYLSAMDGMVRAISTYRNYKSAIGYSFLFYITEMAQNSDIKLLKVNGVYPSRESIANGTYPVASEFYAVTAGSDNPNIEALIDWILSGQGQYIVKEVGYTPL
ncbi:MAG: substrate-binding domain-containing protein [Eubacteriaceae bacterium]|nr:substrate-binding domain-containing protein [Eubacteriaceae bacterium]